MKVNLDSKQDLYIMSCSSVQGLLVALIPSKYSTGYTTYLRTILVDDICSLADYDKCDRCWDISNKEGTTH